jgi:ribosomal protein S15P/S13E
MALRFCSRSVLNSVTPLSVARPQTSNVRYMSFVPLKVDLPKELVTPNIENAVSLSVASSKELYQHRVGEAVKKFGRHKSDTGTYGVQSKTSGSAITLPVLVVYFGKCDGLLLFCCAVATMTEQIQNLTRHFMQHKKDKGSKRGFMVTALVTYCACADVCLHNPYLDGTATQLRLPCTCRVHYLFVTFAMAMHRYCCRSARKRCSTLCARTSICSPRSCRSWGSAERLRRCEESS